MYKSFFKRFFDLWISLIVLVLISPLLLVIIIWLHFANKGTGVFFTQERPGKGGKIFKVIKFKTMTDERDGNGELLPDEDRLTKPLLVEYLPLYSEEQMRRHEVKPGISGWAQCHGRNTISWTEKFKLDVWYVDHLSLWTDIKVIFITIKNVLMRKDINSETAATMEAFNGHN